MFRKLRREFKKEELANRFAYYPLIRLLLFNFWFRLAFASFVLFLVFLPLFLLKIWTVTPPGFLPVVKISGLDFAQAWSLQRTAMRATKAGQIEQANFAWRGAIANHPAKPELLRGALQNVLQIPRADPQYLGLALGQAHWLLRLTATNQADAELLAGVYEKYRLHDQLVYLLTPFEDRLSAKVDVAYLKALFHTGQIGRFAERWPRVDAKSDAELPLYEAAYQVGWGPSKNVAPARQKLEAALTNTIHRVLANRLQLAVSFYRSDTARYHESLQRLTQWQEDSLMEHAPKWQLHAAAGRKTEAQKLSRAYERPPASAPEVVRLSEILSALGLSDEARDLMQRHAVQFSTVPGFWIAYGNLLVEASRWDEVRALALRIRQLDQVGDSLAGFSYYLEGRSDLSQHRLASAKVSFQQAAQLAFDHQTLGISVAASLLKLGYPAHAREILQKLESALKNHPYYWQELFQVAYDLKQADLLRTAAAKALALRPANPVFINNYAAVLLIFRERPEEAIKHTLQLLSRYPDSVITRINHAVALVQNGRTREAETILAKIDLEKLSAREAASFYLARYEVYFNLGQFAEARQTRQRIDSQYLFPAQIQWLELTQQKLPARADAR